MLYHGENNNKDQFFILSATHFFEAILVLIFFNRLKKNFYEKIFIPFSNSVGELHFRIYADRSK